VFCNEKLHKHILHTYTNEIWNFELTQSRTSELVLHRTFFLCIGYNTIPCCGVQLVVAWNTNYFVLCVLQWIFTQCFMHFNAFILNVDSIGQETLMYLVLDQLNEHSQCIVNMWPWQYKYNLVEVLINFNYSRIFLLKSTSLQSKI